MLDLLKTNRAADASPLAAGAADERPAGVVMIPLRKILDNPYQPRGHYDAEHILNLALSIREMRHELPATRGLQQVPLARAGLSKGGGFDISPKHAYATGQAAELIRHNAGARVQLMFGHSRLRAFMVLSEGLKSLRDGASIGMSFAGVAEIESRFAALMEADPDYAEMPLLLGFALDHAMWAHAITENSQRKNITAIEEAQSIQRAIDEFGLTTEEAGRPFGYARSTTANKVRLLQLPASVKAAIADGRLTERHGRELVRLVDDPARLKEAVDHALKKGWTVRQLTDDVNWRESAMKAEQQKAGELAAAASVLAAGWSLPGQDVPVPAGRVTNLDDWQFHEFDATNGQQVALLASGGCGPQCECLVLGFSRHRYETAVRPDPEGAPHVCVGCKDITARRAKLAAITDAAPTAEEIAERNAAAEHKAQAQALNDESASLWQAWVKGQDLQGLWSDIRFWKAATKHHGLAQVIAVCESVQDACPEILRMLYRRTRRWDMELGVEVHKPDDVRELIKALGGKDAA